MITDPAHQHLRADPVMAQLIDRYDSPPGWRDVGQINLFVDVVESIIGQQLSNKVADMLTTRFHTLLAGRPFEPAIVMTLDNEAMRACGLSYGKIRYIKGIAEAALSGEIDFSLLPHLSDAEVMEQLTKLKGIGPWTVEMLLIFSLHRPDVFSVGDLGLRTAVSRLYGVDREDKLAIATIAERWSPYRSLASRYLWMGLDNENRPATEAAA